MYVYYCFVLKNGLYNVRQCMYAAEETDENSNVS